MWVSSKVLSQQSPCQLTYYCGTSGVATGKMGLPPQVLVREVLAFIPNTLIDGGEGSTI